MCFSNQPAQPANNPAPFPVDQAYKSVVASSGPDDTQAPAVPSPPQTPATSERTVRTGITFDGR